MTAGGITVVRGSTATLDELSFILQSGKCQALIIQDAEALKKLAPALQSGKVRP
jgi:long-subunit acyl-CoA synthetase (AMP-forming)